METKTKSKLQHLNIEAVKELLPLGIESSGKVIAVLSSEPCDCVDEITFTKVKRGNTSFIKSLVDKGCHEVVKGSNQHGGKKEGIYLRKP